MKDFSVEYIASLVVKYQNGELSDSEHAELKEWISASERNSAKFDEWINDRNMQRKLSDYHEIDEEKGWQLLEEKLKVDVRNRGKVVGLRKIWIAAASVLVLAVAGYWFINQGGGNSERGKNSHVVASDVKAPDASRAFIKTADGRMIYLDSVANGQLASQGSVMIVKLADGKIGYKPTAVKNGSVATIYNTLSNPRGSKVISMTLSDGSVVWLNSGSSITYPVAFSGDERSVSMTGEAYFEVKHNDQMPFRVLAGSIDVKVLGTHFNVKSYQDEDVIKTTLLQGSVVVNKGDQYEKLKPGEQALLLVASNKLQMVSNVNLEEVMAWKNGLFQFNNAGVDIVMKEISRWYDVEVSYPLGIPNEKFWGSIRRDQNLSDVFKVLQESGGHFKITGRKVEVLP